MRQILDPRIEILPSPQRDIWPQLAPTRRLHFVLYGGTAVALHLGHRQSLDFDFFRTAPLDKNEIRASFIFMDRATVAQDSPDTLVVTAHAPSGTVKVSFFGGIGFGRVNDPLATRDGTLLVASLDDLLATKLKAILDRAEARDYRDIAALISAGVSLSVGLGAFERMFGAEPSQVLRAIGFFKDGDLPTLGKSDRELLKEARDQVGDVPDVRIIRGDLTGDSTAA